MYRTLNEHLRQKFGTKVYKLSVDAGFTCPNRDGKIGNKGCIFCSEFGSGEFAERGEEVIALLENAKKRVEHKNKDGKYIAYFQSFTNTYAPVERLEKLYTAAISPDYIVGLSVATRPDCLPDETVELLKRLNRQKPIMVELGFQTSNEKTAEYIRRGYKNDVYFNAVKRLKSAGIEVVTHIIIGLPGESRDDAVETTRKVVAAGSNGVKFHLLHIIRGTDLEKEYNSGKITCLSQEEYAQNLKACVAVLPKDVTVHRITGDGAKRNLVAPLWSADKKRVLNYLNKYLSEE